MAQLGYLHLTYAGQKWMQWQEPNNCHPWGKTQYGTYCHPICRGPGGKYQVHMLQIWYKDTLQGQQDPQADTFQT